MPIRKTVVESFNGDLSDFLVVGDARTHFPPIRDAFAGKGPSLGYPYRFHDKGSGVCVHFSDRELALRFLTIPYGLQSTFIMSVLRALTPEIHRAIVSVEWSPSKHRAIHVERIGTHEGLRLKLV